MITSVNNSYIKELIKIKNGKTFKEDGLYIIEGEHLVIEANKHGLLKEIITLNEMQIDDKIKTTLVSEEVMKKITSLKSIPTIIGVCIRKESNEVSGNRLLILDNVSDPGNLGTIIRSAKAFNIDTIILGDDCVSLYNEKVLRSTQGLHFSINIIKCDLLQIIPKLKADGYDILSAVVSDAISIKTIKTDKYALIVGNEGLGIKKEILDITDKKVTIKMNTDCESLNVSIATAICLYELSNE